MEDGGWFKSEHSLEVSPRTINHEPFSAIHGPTDTTEFTPPSPSGTVD